MEAALISNCTDIKKMEEYHKYVLGLVITKQRSIVITIKNHSNRKLQNPKAYFDCRGEHPLPFQVK